ncbi:MAG TPA: hypothetical protein VE978_05465 [Chitinophagales bacterium]|nr:hypothetical protein [Chitinophagales bacterium]
MALILVPHKGDGWCSNKKVMLKLSDIDNEMKVDSGAIVRLYNVRRFDIIKERDDNSNIDNWTKDFYDYILVDIGIINQGMFLLLNITLENNSRGSVLCAFDNVGSKGWIKAKIIKDYFGDSSDAFLILNTLV